MKSTAVSIQDPLQLPNGRIIKNRIAKAAMSETLADLNGSPTKALALLYQRYAEGGVGLNITGNVMISAEARGEPRNVILEKDSPYLSQFSRWATLGRANNTELWMQLNHPGKQAPKYLNRYSVAPSAIAPSKDFENLFYTPKELTESEIEKIIKQFSEAATLAKQTGFSGVQIHGAHGYLITQFLSPKSNIRKDQWGGSPENRRRFLVEVYLAIRQRVGADFPVGLKLNSSDFQKGGTTEEESMETIKTMTQLGVDLLEISGGSYETPVALAGSPDRQSKSTGTREAYFLEFAKKAQIFSNSPILLTGGFRSGYAMQSALASGEVNMIGLARPMAMDPDFPNKLLSHPETILTLRKITSGIASIDKSSMMEILWYSHQLHRISRGKSPNPDQSGLRVLLSSLLCNGWNTFRTRGLRSNTR